MRTLKESLLNKNIKTDITQVILQDLLKINRQWDKCSIQIQKGSLIVSPKDSSYLSLSLSKAEAEYLHKHYGVKKIIYQAPDVWVALHEQSFIKTIHLEGEETSLVMSRESNDPVEGWDVKCHTLDINWERGSNNVAKITGNKFDLSPSRKNPKKSFYGILSICDVLNWIMYKNEIIGARALLFETKYQYLLAHLRDANIHTTWKAGVEYHTNVNSSMEDILKRMGLMDLGSIRHVRFNCMDQESTKRINITLAQDNNGTTKIHGSRKRDVLNRR